MTTETNIVSALTTALIQQHGTATFWPRQAVQIITSDSTAGNNPHHVERDVRELRRIGIEPRKICGRWIVTAGQIAQWAAGELRPARIDRRRREHRQEVRHG